MRSPLSACLFTPLSRLLPSKLDILSHLPHTYSDPLSFSASLFIIDIVTPSHSAISTSIHPPYSVILKNTLPDSNSTISMNTPSHSTALKTLALILLFNIVPFPLFSLAITICSFIAITQVAYCYLVISVYCGFWLTILWILSIFTVLPFAPVPAWPLFLPTVYFWSRNPPVTRISASTIANTSTKSPLPSSAWALVYLIINSCHCYHFTNVLFCVSKSPCRI